MGTDGRVRTSEFGRVGFGGKKGEAGHEVVGFAQVCRAAAFGAARGLPGDGLDLSARHAAEIRRARPPRRAANCSCTSGRPTTRWPTAATGWGRCLTRPLAWPATSRPVPAAAVRSRHNVTVFTSVDRKNKEANQGVVHAEATADEFRESLQNVSPSFPQTSQPALADLLPSAMKGCISPPRIGSVKGVDITQRNTPALFGADLIDAIPDRMIIANERKQRLKWGLSDSDTDDYPVGRAIRLSGKTGRQIRLEGDTLVRFPSSSAWPVPTSWGWAIRSRLSPFRWPRAITVRNHLDLTDKQCDQITAFVASLPHPREIVPDSPEEAKRVRFGQKIVCSVGCADCHSPDLGEAKGIYSDLLLHRMGKELVGGGTYGDPPPELPAFEEGGGPQPSEWRTPPLWGVADSAPYLHDGRAATLEDAIKLHGGQAKKSAERFSRAFRGSAAGTCRVSEHIASAESH